MPMLRSLPKRNKLMVDGPEFKNVITHLISRTDDVNVSLEEIESLYCQLADYVEGSPNASSNDSGAGCAGIGCSA